jgi:hypothetical protein
VIRVLDVDQLIRHLHGELAIDTANQAVITV